MMTVDELRAIAKRHSEIETTPTLLDEWLAQGESNEHVPASPEARAAHNDRGMLLGLLQQITTKLHGDCLWCERNTTVTGHDRDCPAPLLEALRGD